MCVLGIDPGSEKCGMAMVAEDGSILEHQIVPVSALVEETARLAKQYEPRAVLIGDGTTSRAISQRLAPLRLPIAVMWEDYTTELGRALYWKEQPPKGWRRLVPRGLLTPPVPYDDYAAVVLVRRFMKNIPLAELQRMSRPRRVRQKPAANKDGEN